MEKAGHQSIMAEVKCDDCGSYFYLGHKINCIWFHCLGVIHTMDDSGAYEAIVDPFRRPLGEWTKVNPGLPTEEWVYVKA